jgi:hypothetical protein
VGSTGRLLRGARGPLADARTVLRQTQVAIPPTLDVTDALSPILPRQAATLEAARAPSRAMGDFQCDVRRFARNWRSFTSFAPVAAPPGPLGPRTALRVLSGETQRRQDAPLGARNAYPDPCQAGNGQ